MDFKKKSLILNRTIPLKNIKFLLRIININGAKVFNDWPTLVMHSEFLFQTTMPIISKVYKTFKLSFMVLINL